MKRSTKRSTKCFAFLALFFPLTTNGAPTVSAVVLGPGSTAGTASIHAGEPYVSVDAEFEMWRNSVTVDEDEDSATRPSSGTAFADKELHSFGGFCNFITALTSTHYKNQSSQHPDIYPSDDDVAFFTGPQCCF